MRRSGLRQRVSDRQIPLLRNGAAKAVFPITCAATQAQVGRVVRVVSHNVSCTQGQLAVCQFVYITQSAGGGGAFTVFNPPRFPNESFTNPFKNPFRPRVAKR